MVPWEDEIAYSEKKHKEKDELLELLQHQMNEQVEKEMVKREDRCAKNRRNPSENGHEWEAELELTKETLVEVNCH